MGTFFDDASLAFLPSGAAGKDGKAYSIKPANGTGDFTFSRGSNLSATRIGPDGLIEKGRENLYTESNNFSDSDWSPKAGTFAKGVTDPNGGTDAWSWTATNTDPFLYQAKNFTGVHCLSIYVKGVGSTIGEDFQIRVGTNIKDITLTGDWQRVQHFGVLSGSVNIGFEYGNPATANDVVHIYAAQLETGLVATEPIESGASTGKAGLLEDEPRFDYSGGATCPSLLLEPSRTQLVTQSEYFGAWGQINTLNTANALISPEGLQNANKLIAASGVNNNVINQQISAGTYTASVFAKKGEFEGLFIGSGPTGAFFNLNTYAYRTHYQSAPTSYKIEDYGNGWHRYSITFTISGNDSLYIGPNDNVSNTLGVTGNNSNGIYIYGAQLEAATYPSSYIPNHSGGSVTRAADDSVATGLGSIAGQSEGTFFAYFKTIGDSATPYISLNQNNGVTNRVLIYNNSGICSEVRVGGAKQAEFTTSTQGLIKAAIAYKANDFAFYINGSQIGTDSSGSTFGAGVLEQLNLGFGAQDGAEINQVLLFDTRLSNAELATLTTL